jgi:DNA-binding SARP family transcriptional activator
LWLSVLGPLEAWHGGTRAELGPVRQQAVLGLLAINSDELVSRESVIDALWGDDPPATAVNLVQAYVSRLRRVLDPGRPPRGSDGLLDRVGTSYRLRVTADQLDLLAFEQITGRARAVRTSGNAAMACGLYEKALTLWRGTPLAGLDLLSGHLAVAHLAGRHAAAVMSYAEAAAAARCPDRALPRLEALAGAEPLNERVGALLMTTLASAGRPDAALRVYQELRRRLDEQLGMYPGPELADAHLRVLRQEVPGARQRRQPRPAGLAGQEMLSSAVPRQLPPAVPHFTGRVGELAALTALLERPGGAAGTHPAVVISAIGGTAGVGKTALAVHWAHQAAERFPDGQLYVNLCGYDPGPPVPAEDALAGFLRALGVPGQDIPPEPAERTARYRSLLAGKRMLIMLDNARSADQVRPLLPGTPACAVLVTSRDALAGLVARDGATRLDLDVLPPQEAVALLRTLVGPRVDAEPEAAAELASQCCQLPLALRVAAELAARHPALPLSALTTELADLRCRLDLLAADADPHTQVRTVFSWSYRHLDAEDARAFRLLGLHPGPHFEPYAAAALTGTTVQQARLTLDLLTRAHLLSPVAPGRYGMHDLLRSYARQLAAGPDAGQDQHAALTRLFDYYLHRAAAATDTLFPAERHRRPPAPSPATPVPPLADPMAAREWLDGELTNLVAAAAHTAAHGWPSHITRLAAILAGYLLNSGHLPEAVTMLNHALGAARRTGDRAAEATAISRIGSIHWQQSRYQQASDQHRQALALFREAGDRAGEGRELSNIGLAEMQLGRYEQAARYQQEAVAIHRDAGDRFGEARALGNLGIARHLQGRFQEAAGYYRQSLALSREIGDRPCEAYALARLGSVDLRLGRHQDGAGYLRQALALFQEMRNVGGEAETLVKLGEVSLGLGRYDQGAENFEQALGISREIGDPVLEAVALNGLGDVLFHAGDAGKARAHHAAALGLASQAGAPREQAHAHSGLARAYHADRDPVQARYHWQEALTRYTAIGAPEADHVRAEMAAVDHDQHPRS